MSWKDEIKSASFRKVRFFFTDIQDGGGRRVNNHLMPGRDAVVNEDVGKMYNSWQISGYLVGDDYLDQWDKLQKAFDRKGPGTFNHPFKGIYSARAGQYTFTNTSVDGGMLTFSITLTEERTITTWRAISAEAKVQGAKKAMISSATDNLNDIYTRDKKPAQYIRDAQKVFNNGIDQVRKVRQTVADAEEFKREIYNSIGKGIELKYTIEDIIGSIINLMDFGSTEERLSQLSPDQIRNRFNELIELSKKYSDPRWSLAKAIQDFQTFIAASAAVGVVTQMSFLTTAEADSTRTTINDTLAELEGNDNTSVQTTSSIRDARYAVNEHLDLVSIRLSQQKNVAPLNVSNILDYTYGIYGNIDPIANIVASNKIDYPGFLAAGVELRVLVNV